MSDSSLLLGVDGGGTKTIVWLAEKKPGITGSFRVVGVATGSPGNIKSQGFHQAMHNIVTTINDAFRNAGIKPNVVDCVCLGLAGAGRAQEQKEIRQWMINKRVAKQAVVSGDAELLLAANGKIEEPADDCYSGVCLVAGTGAMSWGRNSLGQTNRSGGWGHLIGDPGSGFSIGRFGVLLACKAGDGRSDEVEFLVQLLREMNLSSVEQLMQICSGPNWIERIASVAPFVFSQIETSTTISEFIRAEACSLARMVHAVATRLELLGTRFPLACTGSVLLKQPVYRSLFEQELELIGIGSEACYYVTDPVIGALRIAHQQLIERDRSD